MAASESALAQPSQHRKAQRAAATRNAALARHGHSSDSPERVAARQAIREHTMAGYIERQLAIEPALRPEQLQRLADLLTAGGDR